MSGGPAGARDPERDPRGLGRLGDRRKPLLGRHSDTINEFTAAPTLLAALTDTTVRFTAIVAPLPEGGEARDVSVERSTDGADGSRSIDLRMGQDRWMITFGTRTAAITRS